MRFHAICLALVSVGLAAVVPKDEGSAGSDINTAAEPVWHAEASVARDVADLDKRFQPQALVAVFDHAFNQGDGWYVYSFEGMPSDSRSSGICFNFEKHPMSSLRIFKADREFTCRWYLDFGECLRGGGGAITFKNDQPDIPHGKYKGVRCWWGGPQS